MTSPADRRDVRTIELYWFFQVLQEQYGFPDEAFRQLEALREYGLEVFAQTEDGRYLPVEHPDLAAALTRVRNVYEDDEETTEPEKVWFSAPVTISNQGSREEAIGRLYVNETSVAEAHARSGASTYWWPKVKWPRGHVDLEERECEDPPVQEQDHRQDARHSNDRAPTEGPETPKPRTRKTRITIAVAHARNDLVAHLNREPTNEQVIERLRSDKETTGAVVDYKDGCLVWQDTKGEYHTTTTKTVANILAKIRKAEA